MIRTDDFYMMDQISIPKKSNFKAGDTDGSRSPLSSVDAELEHHKSYIIFKQDGQTNTTSPPYVHFLHFMQVTYKTL